MKIICVIPARYGSTRFEGKPLVEICNKPMIQRVYEQAKKSNVIDEIYIATDDTRIRDCAELFGAKVIMTSKDHACGTDRITEAIKSITGDIIINVQGDEPLIDPKVLDTLAQTLVDDSTIEMATLITAIKDKNELNDPNIVKVVRDLDNFALYFSRSLIPYSRDDVQTNVFKHIGIYVYRKDFLLRFSAMEPTFYENIEKLEQLRALERGHKIKVVETTYDSVSIDVPEDVEKVERILNDMSLS